MSFRLLLLLTISGYAHSGICHTALDSLRTEKIKGKRFIIHRVDPQETLYAISKKYDVSIDELSKQNPSLKEGLKMYDEIKVPYSKKKRNKPQPKITQQPTKTHVVKQGQTLFAISKQYKIPVDDLISFNALENATLSIGDTLLLEAPMTAAISNNTTTDTSKIHIVKPSETLFGISKKYQVEISDIQQWNQLNDYNLSIGQQLIISQGIESPTQKAETTQLVNEQKPDSVLKIVKPKAQKLDTLYVRTDNSQFKTKTKEVEGKKKVHEEGFAMKIEDTDYTKKFLALHRTAPLGSTISVKNEMNQQVIEARVVGRLPESALNKSLLMRLSSAAYSALGARDLKTPVTASYLKDEK